MKRRLPKLIASDIDGTLLPLGSEIMPEEIFPLIRRLDAHGIIFCPASGRQYSSMRRLFAPVADSLCFLCENGSIIFGPGTEETAPILSTTRIPRATAMELAHDIEALPDCDALISGTTTTYVCRKTKVLQPDMEHLQGNRMGFYDVPEDIPEDIIKLAVYAPDALRASDDALRPKWGPRLNMAVAGRAWIDFTRSDKGTGIRALCAALDIDPAEVLAIGDNWNDLPMLDAVGMPWLMVTAAPELKARYQNHCRSVPELLEGLLAGTEA